MNFRKTIINLIRILLFPLSFLYGLILYCRYWLYKKKYLRSATFAIPTICVGNLSVGGTGKSPMVLYLLSKFSTKFNAATLSRGYKRNTKGFLMANEKESALRLGDEPFLFYKKFPNATIVVCEDRLFGYTQLMFNKPKTNLVIFDDAMQHRSIEASINICLTTYDDLYLNDYYLPTGNLRDHKANITRCKIIVVTKCPDTLTIDEANKIKTKINQPKTAIYFSTIKYNSIYNPFTNDKIELEAIPDVFLCTGIANPKPIQKFLTSKNIKINSYILNDHFKYTKEAVDKIISNANGLPIITTEKDMVKLFAFENVLHSYPIYVLPITMEILLNQEQQFLSAIERTLQH